MLTDQQDKQLERLQSTALQYVYGYVTCGNVRKIVLADLETEKDRTHRQIREQVSENEQFLHWFPRHRDFPKKVETHTRIC